jgi:hypothetical protein
LGPKSIAGYVPLQRISSFETLANGFGNNTSAKIGTVRGAKRPRGYRRESVTTQAAQQVLDEVFRSSIRGASSRNAMYGTVRSVTIKPRTVDWIQEIPTPMLRPRSSMSHSLLNPPLLAVSAPSDVDIVKCLNPRDTLVARRRKVSLASTVMESDEDISETTIDRKSSPKVALIEEADGDDEFDEVNAVLEDDDVSDQDIDSRILHRSNLGPPVARKPRPPIRRNSSKTGRQLTKSRQMRSPQRRGEKSPGKSAEKSSEVDANLLLDKLTRLERMVEKLSERMIVH